MAQVTNLDSKKWGKEGEASAEAPVKKGPKKLITLLVIVFIVILVLGALFYFLTQGQKEEAARQTEEIISQNELRIPDLNKPFIPQDDIFEQNPLFTEQMEFTINLVDGRRFLKTSLKLGLTDENALAYLNTRLPMVKDIIITTTQLTSSTDFRSGTGVEQYKRNLIIKINSAVFTQDIKAELKDPNPIKKVLFEEFILQ